MVATAESEGLLRSRFSALLCMHWISLSRADAALVVPLDRGEGCLSPLQSWTPKA